MTTIHKIKEKSIFLSKFYLLFMVTIIVNSGYVLSTVYDVTFLLAFLIPTFILLIFSFSFLKIDRTDKYKNTNYYVLLCIGIALSTIINYTRANVMPATRFLLVITVAFLVSNIISFKVFISGYIRAMKYITLISLAVFIAANYLSAVFNLPVVQNVNGVFYKNGYAFFLMMSSGSSAYKNIGVFWEPGLFSSFLLIAIVFEILFKDKETASKFNISLFVLGILSTQSTAGIMLLVLVGFLAIGKRLKKNVPLMTFLIIFFTFIVIYFYDQILDSFVSLNPDIFSKLTEMDRKTTATRINAPLYNLEIWLKNPIFGLGFNNAAGEFANYMQRNALNITAQTSTSTLIMASLGISGIIYTIAWVFSIMRMPKMNAIIKAVLLLLFIIIVNKEPHINNLCTWCILFYLINESKSAKSITVNDNVLT